MPQLRCLNFFGLLFKCVSCIVRQYLGCGNRRHFFALCIDDGGQESVSGCFSWSITYVCPYVDASRFTFVLCQVRGCDPGAIPIDVSGRLYYQTYVPVDTSAKYMFACTRGKVRAPTVVYPDGYQVFPFFQVSWYVDGKSGISSFVSACQVSVDENLCFLKYAIEFKKTFLAKNLFFYRKSFTVPSVAYIKVLRHEIWSTERVGKSYFLPFWIVEPRSGSMIEISLTIFPSPVKVDGLSWRICPANIDCATK